MANRKTSKTKIKEENARRALGIVAKEKPELTPEERAKAEAFSRAFAKALFAAIGTFVHVMAEEMQRNAIIDTRELWEKPIDSTDNETLADLTEDCKVQ